MGLYPFLGAVLLKRAAIVRNSLVALVIRSGKRLACLLVQSASETLATTADRITSRA